MMTIGYLGTGEKGNRPIAFYETLLAKSLAKGYDLFYFTQDDILPEKRKINGTFYDIKNRCHYQRLVPYPDIVEMPNRKLSTILDKPGVRDMFNESVLTQVLGYDKKTKLNKILQKNNLDKYDIETWHYKDLGPEYVLELLEKHSALIFKPIDSKGGENVYCLKKTKDQLSVVFKTQKVKITNEDFLTEYNQIFSSAEYIVQPFYNFTTKDGTPFDIRMNLHLDKNGKWEHIGTFLRVGNPNGVVSNLSSGGYVITQGVNNFLDINVGNTKKIMAEVEFIQKNLGSMIQKAYNEGAICTIAFDIGVDRDTKEVKIIEINSKPVPLKNLIVAMADVKIDFWEYVYPRKESFLKKQRKKLNQSK